MKRMGLFDLVLVCVFSTVGLAGAGDVEVQGSFDTFFPGGNLWEGALGGEARVICWRTAEWGVAYSAGFSQWRADERSVAVSPDLSRAFGGSVGYVPLGASLITRGCLPGSDRASCTVEAGLHYFVCNSGLTLTETANVPVGGGQTEEQRDTYDVKCEGGLVARLAGGLEWALRGECRVFARGGYQFDLDKGEATVEWIDFHQRLELRGFFVQVGIGIPF
jgi:hypothetical protein